MTNIDPNRLCPSCLNEMPQRGIRCPHCGYAPGTEEVSPRCMPPYTILAGRYFIGTVLGEGGFGITYRGWDLQQGRKIAIKEYFPAGLVTRDTSRGGDNTVQSISGQMREHYQVGLEKYENEAKCLIDLKGTPGIVDILAFFHENATAYIIMEFIEGMTLRNYLTLNQGCLAEATVLDMFRPLLCSLDSIHKSGIVHRDISPDNIIVQPDGTLKLIDFGAARQSTGQATQSLTVILKHGYAPEEQYRSHSRQGPFTDVYAISATLYKVLTGVTPVDSMSRMFEDELRPLEDFPNNISPQVCAAIKKGMAVRAENRFQTVGELVTALYDKIVTIQPTIGMPVSKRKHTGKMLLLIAAGLAACAGIIIGISSLTTPKIEAFSPVVSRTEVSAPETPEEPEPVTEQPLVLPQTVGKTEEEARAELDALGVVVSVVYAPADGTHTGKVLSCEQTSEQSATLTVGELTPYSYVEVEGGLELTGVSEKSDFMKIPDAINGIPVVSIGDYAFAETEAEITSGYGVELPNQLRRIGKGAFSDWTYLEELVLPDTVTEIEDGAFQGCTSMGKLTLSQNLERIGDFAFQYCFSIQEIVLPDGCKQVGTQAFEGCLFAEKIVIPRSVTEIGPGAFTACDNAVMQVSADSYAEEYAKLSDLPYEIQ